MLGFVKRIINRFRSPLVQLTRQNELLASIDNRLQQLTDEINSIKKVEETSCEKTIQQIEGWTWERYLRSEAILNKSTDMILQEINNLYNDLSDRCKTQYWENSYEKTAIKNNWADVQSGVQDRYFRLIDGLDDESISVVNRILNRQSRYLSDDNERIDLFTEDEQAYLRKIKDAFAKEIVKLSEDMYAYGRYLLPINHFEAVIFYYKYCIPELEKPEQIKGTTIIDAGAYIGDTALLLSELSPERIVLFEPVPENMELCKKTVQMNNLSGIVFEQRALGAEQGILEMYIAGEGSTVYPRCEDQVFYQERTITVPVITLDQYVETNNMNVGLIKADIEGSESDLLCGARSVITKQRPVLIICIYHNSHDFFEIKTMLESWDLDYRFKIRKPIVQNATYETMLIAEPND